MTQNAPAPRSSLDAIPAYRPGKPPVARPDLVSYKMSSNENPFDPLPGVLAAAQDALSSINRYPDFYGFATAAAIAEKFGVAAESVVLGPGSVGALTQLIAAVCDAGDEVVFAWRSFEAYPLVVQVAGAKPVMVPLDADHRHDLPAMADAITERTKAVFVCTPNNPTGTTVTAAELDAFLDRVPPHVLVVIDEAYAEFVRDDAVPDAFELFRTRPNVAVLRTFSKAYGLAGLRIGYAVVQPVLADALRKTMLPFSVSNLAQAAALASLARERELLDRVEVVVGERARVVGELMARDWPVPVTHGNFFWLPLGDDSARFADACGEQGLTVRAFAGEGVRCSVAEQAANDRLLKVCAEFGTP